tara:strand:- start:3700 stop:4329 length:630 start_codon:yes stop_codon:yes gene_type:complete
MTDTSTPEAPLNITDGTPLDFLASRRSVLASRMEEPGPSQQQLDQMLEIAVRVPDHGRMTPWVLQIVSPAAQIELGELFVEEFRKIEPDAKDERVDLERVRPQRSPVLVVVSSRTVPDRDGVPPVEQLLSAGNVCFNLLHAATAMGFAAQWVTNWPSYNDRIKASLGIPTSEHLVGFIHIGTPKGPPSERQRPVMAEVVETIDSLKPVS